MSPADALERTRILHAMAGEALAEAEQREEAGEPIGPHLTVEEATADHDALQAAVGALELKAAIVATLDGEPPDQVRAAAAWLAEQAATYHDHADGHAVAEHKVDLAHKATYQQLRREYLEQARWCATASAVLYDVANHLELAAQVGEVTHDGA